MSATGRNRAGRERHPADYYATPGWATRAILPHLPMSGLILEPAAGDGAIVRELVRSGGVDPGIIESVELEPREWDAPAMPPLRADYLGYRTNCRFSLAITNPPYSLAQEFVDHARTMADTVAMLLRLSFLGAQKRGDWHRANPCDVYVLDRRPSFAHGHNDNCEYGWFVWSKGRGNRIYVLDCEKEPRGGKRRAA